VSETVPAVPNATSIVLAATPAAVFVIVKVHLRIVPIRNFVFGIAIFEPVM
jgi:hypothetical protein